MIGRACLPGNRIDLERLAPLEREESMAKTEPTPSMADLAEQVGRQSRSRYVNREDRSEGPLRRLWPLVTLVMITTIALLVWYLLA